jgi:hypothetical protein
VCVIADNTVGDFSVEVCALETIRQQCCCAFVGVFTSTGKGLQMSRASDSFAVPPFADRSSYCTTVFDC